MQRILLVEDDSSIVRSLTAFLAEEGFSAASAPGERRARELLCEESFDLLLVDISLADGSGFGVCAAAKERGLPVIFLTAFGDEGSVVTGLDMGADDYIAKPFRPRELVSRIRSVLRRHQRGGYESLDAGNVRLWPDSRRVEVAGREVELLRKEYDILHYFMSRPNHTVDKTALAEGVWGDHIDQADNFDFVYAQMKNLRRKLHDAGADIEIRAVYGFGYKLVQP